MILIFGGAYQGKLDYVLKTFSIASDDVFHCTRDDELSLEKTVICGLEDFVYSCTVRGEEARDVLASMEPQLRDKILIADDISQGLVPMDAADRVYREMMGRTLIWLAREADSVFRVFCGLGQQLK